MLSIHIDFTRSAWWLLLLIPAVILTLIPYFRLSKKYRRTSVRLERRGEFSFARIV